MAKKLTHQEFLSRVEQVNSDIEIISEYLGYDLPIYYQCKKCGYKGRTRPEVILRGQKCRGCVGRTDKDEYRQKLYERFGDSFVLIDDYSKQTQRVTVLCSTCGGVHHVFPVALLNSKGCPYCSGKKVLRGLNDLWTTHPDVASILLNPDDGYKYSAGSGKEVKFKCPNCQQIHSKKIQNVVNRGFSCPCDNSGASFGEKIFAALLDSLSLQYEYDKATSWSQGRRYDFIIEGRLVCEIMGAQHYRHTFNSIGGRTPEEEQKNDELKQDMAIKNGLQYISIQCLDNDFNTFKKNILESNLSVFYDLSNVDWKFCHRSIIYPIDYDVINMWNQTHSVKEASSRLHMHPSTVRTRLRNSAGAGLCDYGKNNL